jgi:glycerophosphoryl diester phosphodiesterase
MNPLLDRAARIVIGHRGAAWYAPENTLESFRLALALGADALEFDLRCSADGEAMVFHDAILDRTTDLHGPVSSHSVAQLKAADAGFHFSEPGTRGTPCRGTGVRIPTLREVIAEFPGVPLLIEVKEPAVAEPAARALEESHATERAVLAGNDWQALLRFRRAPFHLGASRRDITRLYFRTGEPDPECRCYAVPEAFYGLPVPTRRFVGAAHRRESTVHVWTVDDARSALRLWDRGVNGIVTNKPDAIRTARDSLTRP